VLDALAADGETPRLLLHGPPGVGKSAIALTVGHRIRQGGRRGASGHEVDVVWVSAQASRLGTDGILDTAIQALNMRDVVTAICATLDRADILRATPGEQIELLRAALARRRVLVICDSLDQIRDPRARSFLDDLPYPTRALATSTARLGFGQPFAVEPLKGHWPERLARQADHATFDGLTPELRSALLRACGGIPLAITWGLAMLGTDPDPHRAIARLDQEESDLLRFCFEELWGSLSVEARQLLAALALFPVGATTETVARVGGLDSERASRAVVELRDRALLESAEEGLSLLPMTRAYTRGRSREEGREAATMRLERWAEEIAVSVTLALREPTWPRIFALLERRRIDLESLWAQAQNDAPPVVEARAGVAWSDASYFLFSAGYWDTLIEHRAWAGPSLLEQGLFEEYLTANLNWLALVLQLRDERVQREACFTEAESVLAGDDEDADYHAAIIDFNRFTERGRSPHFEERVHTLRRAAEVFASRGEDQWQAMAANRLGNTPGLEDGLAEDAYSEALSITRRHSGSAWARELEALAIGNLGIVANRRSEWRKALELLTQAEPGITQISDTATLNMELAIANFHLGRIRAARECGRKALEVGDRLRLKVAIAESYTSFESDILPSLQRRKARHAWEALRRRAGW
jgi:tetratricopeptide (TPR) repeat protein